MVEILEIKRDRKVLNLVQNSSSVRVSNIEITKHKRGV